MDSYRKLYLQAVVDRLEGDEAEAVIAKAQAVLGKWRNVAHMDSYYVTRWSELLEAGRERLQTIVMADSEEAEQLRHCMPFANILSHKERSELRRLASLAKLSSAP